MVATITTVKHSDIRECPHFILVPQHYRADGTCRCDDIMHTVMVEWGYTWSATNHAWETPPC